MSEPIDIKRAREIIAAATPGEWRDRSSLTDPRVVASGPLAGWRIPVSNADAAFIAEARTGWPAALDALESAQRSLDAWEMAAHASARDGMSEAQLAALTADEREVDEAHDLLDALGVPCGTGRTDPERPGTDLPSYSIADRIKLLAAEVGVPEVARQRLAAVERERDEYKTLLEAAEAELARHRRLARVRGGGQ